MAEEGVVYDRVKEAHVHEITNSSDMALRLCTEKADLWWTKWDRDQLAELAKSILRMCDPTALK